MSQPSPSHIRATAVCVATLRRLALSVLFTIATTSYQTTCIVSETTFNKRQHTNARYRVESLTLYALRQFLSHLTPILSQHTGLKLNRPLDFFFCNLCHQIKWIHRQRRKTWTFSCAMCGAWNCNWEKGNWNNICIYCIFSKVFILHSNFQDALSGATYNSFQLP